MICLFVVLVGACWDRVSTGLGFCTSDVSPQSLIGVFDRDDVRNNFRDYTVVQALYCSGDVWGGNVTQKYDDADGVPVQQMGLTNAQATVDWVLAQQASGALAKTFSNLVVMGCSAGSVGTQLWSKVLLSTFKYQIAAVVPDSYAGVFPPDSQGPLIRSFGYCTWNKITKSLLPKCLAGQLTLQDINNVNQAAYPRVPFGFIESKTDNVQMEFYVAIGLTTPKTSGKITPANFYNNVTSIFGSYNKQRSNFVTYLVDGFNHCFTNKALYYDANCLNPKGSKEGNTCLELYEWTGSFPLSSSGKISTQCQGQVQPTSSVTAVALLRGATAFVASRNSTKTTYCSATVVPKTYTQM